MSSKPYKLNQMRIYFNCFGGLLALPNLLDTPIYFQLMHAGEFEKAQDVIELGSGRGYLAALMLSRYPSVIGRVVLTDVSDALIKRLRKRFRASHWVEIYQVVSDPPFPYETNSFDRFVSCFVLEMMDKVAQERYLREAHRLLREDGLLCAMVVTAGITPFSRLVMGLGQLLVWVSPWLALGARYTNIIPLLAEKYWQVIENRTVVSMGCTTQIIVARKVSALRSQA